jgi:hypothetical protein
MSGRHIRSGDLRKNSIRKFALGRKRYIRADAATAEWALQFPYAIAGHPALIAYRLLLQEPAVKLEAPRHG